MSTQHERGVDNRSDPASGPLLALVAGEDSGDQLGADLIEALRARFPDMCWR